MKKKLTLTLHAVRISCAVSAACIATSAFADDKPIEAHVQATYVRQVKPSFSAAYSGPKSLVAARAYGYSLTATAFFGARLGEGWEAYWNPEVTQGAPLSELQGLGGFNNGESQRTAGPSLRGYNARAFVRRTWNVGGEYEEQASEANQVRTRYAAERVVVTAGGISVLDVFDALDYSRDPRTQFLNWASLTYGAWDYPADARGYTKGVAVEYISPAWQVRAGRFLMPKESNGLPLDWSGRQYGDVVEVERPYRIGQRNAVVRALAFRNRVNAGSFQDALAQGSPPDVTLVRRLQSKSGFGLSTQVEITPQVGAYARAGWNDGKTETYAFTEIDRSLAGGVLIKGNAWNREQDTLGFAGYLNGLSRDHREYLAAGGQGFFLGDGRLNYGLERILEAFYSFGVARGTWLTADFQHIENPGYNRDRGPARVFNLRAHFEL
jgi:hypothetical protein